MSESIQQQLMRELDRMPLDKQREVVEFARSIAQVHVGTSKPDALLKMVGSISLEDLDLMERIIEQECERIDPNDW